MIRAYAFSVFVALLLIPTSASAQRPPMFRYLNLSRQASLQFVELLEENGSMCVSGYMYGDTLIIAGLSAIPEDGCSRSRSIGVAMSYEREGMMRAATPCGFTPQEYLEWNELPPYWPIIWILVCRYRIEWLGPGDKHIWYANHEETEA